MERLRFIVIFVFFLVISIYGIGKYKTFLILKDRPSYPLGKGLTTENHLKVIPKKGLPSVVAERFSCAFAEQEKFSSAIKKLDEKEIEEMLGEKKPATQEVIVKPNVEYKAQDLRDPFQGPFVPKETPEVGPGVLAAPQVPPSLEVQGIIWGGDFPQAIINNKVVKIGDTIEGVQIMDINQSGVIVASGDYTYNLPSPAQKQEKERQGGEK